MEGLAQPAAEVAAFQPKPPSDPVASGSAIPRQAHHRAQKSADEILKIFDQPRTQDGTFSSLPAHVNGQSFFAPGFFPQDMAAMQQAQLNLSSEANFWPAFPLPQVCFFSSHAL